MDFIDSELSLSVFMNTRKHPVIVVTNACTLSCGGCLEFCGSFTKDQLFFISLDEFRSNIESVIKWLDANPDIPPNWTLPWHLKFIGIYGGEPTIHPQWSELLEIMHEYEDYPFIVYTNGHWMNLEDRIGETYDCETQTTYPPLTEVSKEEVDNVVCAGVYQEVFEKILKREGYKCQCGETLLSVVGMNRIKYPRNPEDRKRIYTRCDGCGTHYKLRAPDIAGGFAHVRQPVLQSEGHRVKFEAFEELKKNKSDLKHREFFEHMSVFEKKNVGYRIGFKDPLSIRDYVSVSVAPMDIYVDGRDWFEEAQEICFIWNLCETAIHRNKAYFCIVAGAMDHLYYDGKYGWELGDGNPFDRTDEEIRLQAEPFCKRCGQCCAKKWFEANLFGLHQLSCGKTLATPTNYNAIKNKKNTILVKPISCL